jgi:cytochrome c2
MLGLLALAVAATPALAQQAAPPATPAPAAQAPVPQPFGPDWASLAGWSVFSSKGCGKCHAVRGVGGQVGPDLARIAGGKSFYDLGAALWNHLPQMGARMRAANIERPRLTAQEASNLIAFLFTAQYYDEQGDPRAGEKLFASKGCVQCHAVGGAGGKVGPGLDPLKRANSPVLVAAAMWNHAPQMAEAMKAKGIALPTFEGKELVDLIAYVVASAQDTSTETKQVIPGTPERGKHLFAEKKCATCHAVGGKGPRVGPDLGRGGHHVSLTQLASRMWNHGPAMTARMKQMGIAVPALSGQDMADILSHLYVSRYFEAETSPARGQEVVKAKGCVTCHAVRGQGGKVAADFAASTVARTPGGLVAGLWNHARLMETQVEKQKVAWPTLTGQEMGDLAALLTSLQRAPARPAPAAPKK